MKTSKNFFLVFVFLLIAFTFILSCNNDEDTNNVLSSEKVITKFNFNDFTPAIIGNINNSNNTINITFPTGIDLTNLRPTLEYSGASVTPNNQVFNNFSNPIVYTVTAEDGSHRDYTVTATAIPSSEKKILSFGFNSINPTYFSIIDENLKKIRQRFPPSVDPTNLTPTITISNNASITPNTGIAQNFTNTINYLVSAQDGSASSYTTEYLPPVASPKDIPTPPKHLCIYYGWPSAINNSNGNVNTATNVLKDFDIIVFGDGIWNPSHGDHNKTITIINNLKIFNPSIKIYGYIDIGVSTQNLSITAIQSRIDAWKVMGVTGVFGDDFGYDFQVTRVRQNAFIDYAHSNDLSVFANSWNIEDSLGGADCHLSSTYGDYYLLESFIIEDGLYASLSNNFKQRGDLAYYYMKTKGVGIASVVRMPTSQLNMTSYNSDKYKQAWYGTAMYNFDAFQFTNINFSSDNSPTYKYPNPISSYGTSWIQSDWVRKVNDTRYERSTNTTTLYIEGDGSATGTGGH